MQIVEVRKTRKGYTVVGTITTLVFKRDFNTKEEAWAHLASIDMDAAFVRTDERQGEEGQSS
jgi:hypothetical protein